eukprot:TRINITY_DN66664_c1_g1_i1.p1 TRINITY_DN66664_c1_g1~~TRINITY_DN66664_c1_g1_i1.p1  ORF type:complete len:390 (+),score=57.22 TRINITY_DN66664_c1_g1_i1:65-1234(+)
MMDPENPKTPTPPKEEQKKDQKPAVGYSWLNPVKVTSWVLEAMLIKDASGGFESQHPNRPLVLVTGAAGYLAANVIKVLIESGYRVRGTVRNLEDKEKVEGLRKEFPMIDLVESDLLKEGSFDKAMDGVKFVVHCACPFIPTVPDPQRDLFEPAVNGALNVLNSAQKAATVKRVILTSSMAAVASEKPPEDKDYKYTEKDWNIDSTLQQGPYRYAKTQAEKAAWEFVHNNQDPRKLELVVLNPSFIVGPPLFPRNDSTSVNLVKSFLDGTLAEKGCQPACYGAVDVRDVAKAHVIALEVAQANGNRFILSSDKGISHLELAVLLKQEFKNFPLPSKEVSAVVFRPNMDTTAAKTVLHMEFTPIQKSMNDMARQLVKFGLVQDPTKAKKK